MPTIGAILSLDQSQNHTAGYQQDKLNHMRILRFILFYATVNRKKGQDRSAQRFREDRVGP